MQAFPPPKTFLKTIAISLSILLHYLSFSLPPPPLSLSRNLQTTVFILNVFDLYTTVLSTSLGKTFFAWCFILNENILFWLTISYQKPFVFYVSVFCSKISTQKLKLRPKVGLTYAISTVKWFFGIFVWENIFYFSLLNLNYWCFTTILWKFQKNWTSGTCWNFGSKLPTL